MKAVVKPVLWIGFKILGGEKIRESMASEMEFVCSVQAACLQLFLFMLHSASFRLTSGIDREAAEGPLQLQAGHEHRYKGDCLEEYHRDNKNISMLIQLPVGAFQEFPKEPAISPTTEWRPGAWLGQDEHFRSNTLWSLLSLGIPQAPWAPKAMTLCCVDCSVLLQWAVARAAAASSCCSLAPLCQLLAVINLLQQQAQQLELQKVPAVLCLLPYTLTLPGLWQWKIFQLQLISVLRLLQSIQWTTVFSFCALRRDNSEWTWSHTSSLYTISTASQSWAAQLCIPSF